MFGWDSGNTLMDGNYIGEAPQFNCANPASTATCSSGVSASGVYGQWDTGQSVFSFYDNLAGTTLSSVWRNSMFGTAVFTVANGLSVTNGGGNNDNIDSLANVVNSGTSVDILSQLNSPDGGYSNIGAINWSYGPSGNIIKGHSIKITMGHFMQYNKKVWGVEESHLL